MPASQLAVASNTYAGFDNSGEPDSKRTQLQESIHRLIQWLEEHEYAAYDPGDGNNSFLHLFTFNNLLLERLLQQAVYRAPFNLRPLLGIRAHTSTKGMGYIAWGYLKMFRMTGDSVYEKHARYCLDWLKANRSTGYEHYCWGNDFAFSSRTGKIPRGEPTIVWSSLIGQAFLEAHEILNDPAYLEMAASICDWILTLPREQTQTGTCLSYVAYKHIAIHNSNMLGAALLARVGQLTKHSKYQDLARDAMTYSCTRQNADGSWFYGENPTFHWIDNFHTGYNLDSLRRYIDATDDRTFEQQLLTGLSYFKDTFFEGDGCPKYYHNRKYPIDIQCAAQAIDTLTFFRDLDPSLLPLAEKVAHWTIDHMQAPDGHFYYRDLGWAVNKTPMLHWGQGTMFKALAHLCEHLPTTNTIPS
jgi:rhamnogalacturonyl hydrolase YesR